MFLLLKKYERSKGRLAGIAFEDQAILILFP